MSLSPMHVDETSKALIEQIYSEAAARYITSRRDAVDGFVARHFSLQGSLRLHRHSVGWDMLKSPINAVSSALTVAQYAGTKVIHGIGARQSARRLGNKNLFIETALGRELDRLIRTELLQMSWDTEDEQIADALMQEICNDPRVAEPLAEAMAILADRHHEPAFQARLTQVVQAYVGSRTAAADITQSLLSVAAGMALFHQLTPGLTALSASVSSSLAHALATHTFWAGPWAGGLYYSMMGVATPKLMMVGVFTGLLIPASILATFSGVLTDPVQRKLGLHQRRLNKLIDAVEVQLSVDDAKPLSFKDHYVARTLDLLDLSQSIIQLTR